MPRPRTITDEQIVVAARAAFLEQGFSATTAEIARRAGVSEGTLFKRFATKEDLFEEVMGLRESPAWHAELSARVGEGDVRRNLERAFLLYLDSARQIVPNLLLVFSRGYAPAHNPLLERLDNPMREDTQALASYLRAEVARGRIRPVDAEMTALALLGALLHFVHFWLMTHRGNPETLDAGRYVRGLLDLLWPGLEP
ncbi:TetR/AcrR family transcriptional regulator [Deinococcus sp. YIM 134068]|uniref:TetR/AcrR family transcriptional regulator n=1 Tax=Deinococcus lichenicola TaxID=3118910 RepID=UPI002F92C306